MISNGSNGAEGAEGADGGTTRRVRGARGRLGGHVPKSGTRSIMVSSMRGNDVGDVVDGNMASKVGDVGDNGGMECRGEVSRGGVEYTSGMKVWEGGVENLCGMCHDPIWGIVTGAREWEGVRPPKPVASLT